MTSTNKDHVTRLAFSGLFAALIFLMTWGIHVPVGLNGGYIHFGDALIYLAATLLPLPYAIAASAIGAGLSDILSPGAIIWLLPTLIIKSISCFAFSRNNASICCKRNVVAVIIASIINVVGYGIATAYITGSIAVAIAEIPLGLVQPIGSAIFFFIFAMALDKAQIKRALPAGIQGRR